jgi:hypothetical protein
LTKTGKIVVCRASSGIGCSNGKGRSRALHPDLTKMGKSVVRRASSGVGCSNVILCSAVVREVKLP